MWKEVAMNDDIYIYEKKSRISLCVLQSERKANLPTSRVNSKSHPNSNRKSTLENYLHQITSFFFFLKSPISISISTSPFPLLPLPLPFLPTSNSSRILKYTSSTKPLFSAAAASSSRIPRIPGPAQGNVKKDFRRWMWRAKYKKEKKKRKRLMLGVFGGGRETDLRSGEFDRFGKYLDDEEVLL